jgi:antitoxin component YwqK of YwqJK toxin-antitoxin module
MIKRRIVLIIAVSVVFVFKINAQDTITVFYDLYMNRTADSSQATYIRKAWKIKDSKLWRVHDYYLKNGNIAMKGVYKSGRLNVKNGYFIYYYENGKKREEGSYRNNYRTGEWKGWFKEGNDKLIYKYETGTLKEVIAYYENGNVKYYGKYLNGLKNGKWTYWNKDGKLSMQGKYKLNKKNGKWTKYFSDDTLTVYFKNGNIQANKLGGITPIQK